QSANRRGSHKGDQSVSECSYLFCSKHLFLLNTAAIFPFQSRQLIGVNFVPKVKFRFRLIAFPEILIASDIASMYWNKLCECWTFWLERVISARLRAVFIGLKIQRIRRSGNL